MNKVVEMVKTDAEEALYRVTANQLTQAVNAALIDILKEKGANKRDITKFKAFLESKYGLALVGILLGYIIENVPLPMFQENDKIKKLAEEFRINGMAVIGNELIGTLMDKIGGKAFEALEKLPATKARIVDSVDEGAAFPEKEKVVVGAGARNGATKPVVG